MIMDSGSVSVSSNINHSHNQNNTDEASLLPGIITQGRPVEVISSHCSFDIRKKRTKDDFLNFCKVVLKYAQYEPEEQEPAEKKYRRNSLSPFNSASSTAEDSSTENTKQENVCSSDDHTEGHDVITCFCNRPFAGRPMIECGSCETWVHLSCAKIRRSSIPEEFLCSKCRENNKNVRKSYRVRTKSDRLKNA